MKLSELKGVSGEEFGPNHLLLRKGTGTLPEEDEYKITYKLEEDEL